MNLFLTTDSVRDTPRKRLTIQGSVRVGRSLTLSRLTLEALLCKATDPESILTRFLLQASIHMKALTCKMPPL
jgi:hypothetical protein